MPVASSPSSSRAPEAGTSFATSLKLPDGCNIGDAKSLSFTPHPPLTQLNEWNSQRRGMEPSACPLALRNVNDIIADLVQGFEAAHSRPDTGRPAQSRGK